VASPFKKLPRTPGMSGCMCSARKITIVTSVTGPILEGIPPISRRYSLRPLGSGFSAQKIHFAPFACFTGGESNPRCSSEERARRYMFANKHCVMSDSSHPCSEKLVLRKARSIFWRFLSNSFSKSLLISSQSEINSAHSSALKTGKFGS